VREKRSAYSERTGSVASSSPRSSSVERESFILDNSEEPSVSERFGVGSVQFEANSLSTLSYIVLESSREL